MPQLLHWLSACDGFGLQHQAECLIHHQRRQNRSVAIHTLTNTRVRDAWTVWSIPRGEELQGIYLWGWQTLEQIGWSLHGCTAPIVLITETSSPPRDWWSRVRCRLGVRPTCWWVAVSDTSGVWQPTGKPPCPASEPDAQAFRGWPIPMTLPPVARHDLPADRAMLRQQWQLPHTGRILVAGGRLEQEAPFGSILRAFDYLKYIHPDDQFICFGTGRQRDRLMRLSRGLARGHFDVRFLSAGRRWPELVAVADGVLVPHRQDGGNCIALEAMRLGRPLLMGQTGVGIPGATGLQVDPWSPVEIARQVRWLWAAPDRANQLGVTAQAWVNQHASPEAFVAQLERPLERFAVT